MNMHTQEKRKEEEGLKKCDIQSLSMFSGMNMRKIS